MNKLKQARYSIGIAMSEENTVELLVHCVENILIVW